mmetsp:Transcript_60302/g.140446  ORF Transcript_60302/g.140446 Transcript_60302/m.140446 type:complete len:242 (-) Transcript_60302:93-818(-)
MKEEPGSDELEEASVGKRQLRPPLAPVPHTAGQSVSEMPSARTCSSARLNCSLRCAPAAVGFVCNSVIASPSTSKKAPPVFLRSARASKAQRASTAARASTDALSTASSGEAPCLHSRSRIPRRVPSTASTAPSNSPTNRLNETESWEPRRTPSSALSKRHATRKASCTSSRPSSSADPEECCRASKRLRAPKRRCCSGATRSSKLWRAVRRSNAAASAFATRDTISAKSFVAVGAGSGAT